MGDESAMDGDTTQRVQQLMSEGQFDEAILLLEEWTRREPGNWQAFTCLGAACAQLRRFEPAILAFRRATQIKPRAANLRFNLGRAYELSGQPIKALHEYETAMRLDSGYSRAREAYAELREQMKARRS
ncbi:MAG: hypothetical protein IT209_10765 [Armatimonadetes bacterium]|nr:hypothetical protein [Armatimonadota bacterium]